MKFDDQDDVFHRIPCTLLTAALIPDRDRTLVDKALGCPTKKTCGGLSTISGLYLYTNPPPIGYGTPSPKVAESVLRTDKYNKNPDSDKYRMVGPFRVINGALQGNTQDFPLGPEPVGNYHAQELRYMAEKFLKANFSSITEVAKEIMEKVMDMNSDTRKANMVPYPRKECTQCSSILEHAGTV